MRVIWLEPWAWAGVAALAAPILIHLLARHRQRELLFPTLRFVRATQLAALKRRVIVDVPLLVVRLLILTTAIAALAAPVFVSAARQQAWAARIARAIVTLDPSSSSDRDRDAQPIIDGARSTAFAAQVFGSNAGAASAIADAIAWLDRQPPAARELVVVGDLREGAMSAADLANVPATMGIRFLPIASREPVRTAPLEAVVEIDGRTTARSLLTTLDDDRTRVTLGPSSRSFADLVTVHAAAGEEAMAAAVRDAVLAEGVRLPRDDTRRLAIEFAGASATDELKVPPASPWMRETLAHLAGLKGGERDGRLVVRAGIRATDPAAVHLVDRVVRAAWNDPLDALEPRRIPPATLAAWSRGPAGAPLETPPGNEGDGRWLWVLALALLALEWRIRRADRKSIDTASQPESEARVA
jgi:hypothetical protein